jgi:hypothetical protein
MDVKRNDGENGVAIFLGGSLQNSGTAQNSDSMAGRYYDVNQREK